MKKLLPLALAINLILSPILIFANGVKVLETATAGAQEMETPPEFTNGESATPTEAPASEKQYDSDEESGDKTQNKDKADAGATSWDGSGYTPQTCPQYMHCDGAPTIGDTSDWNNILVLIGTLFGSSNSTSSNSTGYTGNSGYGTDTIGTPTVNNPTTTVDMPTGDFSTVTPNGEADPNWSDVPTSPDLSNITLGLLGGIPISPNASYTYSYVGPGSFRVSALVNPLNPEIDMATQFTALVTPTKNSVHVLPPSQTVTETYTQGGTYYKIFKFTTMEYASNSKPRYGQLNVKINVNVYQGSTSLCSSEDSGCDNGLTNSDEFGNLPTDNATTTGGSADIGTDFSGLTGTGTNTSSNGSDLLDNIFSGGAGSGGNSASNNANNPDWLSDGFSNIAQNNGNAIPDGFGSQFADAENVENFVSIPTDDSTIAPISTEYSQPYTTGYNTGYSDASTPTTGNAGGPAETASVQDSALGNIFGKIDSIIGNNPASPSSLTAKFASLTNSVSDKIESTTGFKLKEDKIPGSGRGLSSDTTVELREIASRMLNASGMSQDDIKKGRQYDQGSAYTDPQDAWNLNRMNASKAKATVTQNQTKSTKSTTTIE